MIYNLKGEWLRNMKIYTEDKMPKDVRAQVKRSQYFDYKITSVQEFKEGENRFYIVHLEDDKNYKQVSVFEGELNLIKEYKKQVQ